MDIYTIQLGENKLTSGFETLPDIIGVNPVVPQSCG